MVSNVLELICRLMLVVRRHHLGILRHSEILRRSPHIIIVVVIVIFLAIEVGWTFVFVGTAILVDNKYIALSRKHGVESKWWLTNW